MLENLNLVKVEVDRTLTDYEVRRLGETLELMGFERCDLNGHSLEVSQMCKVDKDWDDVWRDFDARNAHNMTS